MFKKILDDLLLAFNYIFFLIFGLWLLIFFFFLMGNDINNRDPLTRNPVYILGVRLFSGILMALMGFLNIKFNKNKVQFYKLIGSYTILICGILIIFLAVVFYKVFPYGIFTKN